MYQWEMNMLCIYWEKLTWELSLDWTNTVSTFDKRSSYNNRWDEDDFTDQERMFTIL